MSVSWVVGLVVKEMGLHISESGDQFHHEDISFGSLEDDCDDDLDFFGRACGLNPSELKTLQSLHDSCLANSSFSFKEDRIKAFKEYVINL